MGAYDDVEETAVHDAWAQVETGCSSPNVSHKISQTLPPGTKKATSGVCKISWKMGSQNENKKGTTTSNM